MEGLIGIDVWSCGCGNVWRMNGEIDKIILHRSSTYMRFWFCMVEGRKGVLRHPFLLQPLASTTSAQSFVSV